MIWDDPNFSETYKRELHEAVLAIEREARGIEEKFHVDVARSGMISGVHLVASAGGIASTALSGYVNRALDTFDSTLALLGAKAEDEDLLELRRRIGVEIDRREESLHARLSTLLKRDSGAAWDLVSKQSPVSARGLLARRIENARAAVRFRRTNGQEAPRAVFISHSSDDMAVTFALRDALTEYLGPTVKIFVSSDFRSIPSGADPYGRIMTALTSSPITIVIVTPNFAESRWLYYETGVADGASRLVIPCVARGSTFASVWSVFRERKQGRDLGDPAAISSLLIQVRAELGLDASDVLLEPKIEAVRVAARRPALAGRLSPEAHRLCETISGKSEHARGDGDPYIKTADFISENGLTMLNLMTTLAELKKLGWLIVDGPRMGPDGLNPRWFQPSEDFFLATEAAFGGPDPWTDAKQLAGGGGGEAGRAITRRRIARAAARLERSSNKRGAIRA